MGENAVFTLWFGAKGATSQRADGLSADDVWSQVRRVVESQAQTLRLESLANGGVRLVGGTYEWVWCAVPSGWVSV